MPSIHDVIRDDDVSGVIVGRHMSVGVLYYEGRPQGGQMYAESEAELRQMANTAFHERLADQGAAVDWIYPNNSAWELRIFS